MQKKRWVVRGLGGILLEILFPPPAQELHQDPLLCPGISLLWFKSLSENRVCIYFNFSLKQGYANTYTHNSQQLKFLLLQFSSKELSKTLDSH